MAAKDRPGYQELRAWYQGSGAIHAGSPAIAIDWLLSESALADIDVDQLAEKATRAVYSPVIFDKSRPELDPGIPVYKEKAGIFFPDADIQAVKDGKSLTVAFALAYADVSLKPRQYWLLTYVARFQGSATTYSILRNRPTLQEAPK